jgi:hypothetical protein
MATTRNIQMARFGSPSQPSTAAQAEPFTIRVSGPILGSRIISQIRPTATDEMTIGAKMSVRKRVEPLRMPGRGLAKSARSDLGSTDRRR